MIRNWIKYIIENNCEMENTWYKIKSEEMWTLFYGWTNLGK